VTFEQPSPEDRPYRSDASSFSPCCVVDQQQGATLLILVRCTGTAEMLQSPQVQGLIALVLRANDVTRIAVPTFERSKVVAIHASLSLSHSVALFPR
jgi:hypothetical protein